MSDHLMVQKALVSSVKDTGLTPSQPKIPDYLLHHDGLIHCRHFTKTDWGNAKIMTYVSNPMFGDERDGSDYC